MSLLRLLSAIPRLWRWWQSCTQLQRILQRWTSDYDSRRMVATARVGAAFTFAPWEVYETLARLNDDERAARRWLEKARDEGSRPLDIVPERREIQPAVRLVKGKRE